MCRAELAWRLPPRLRRWRCVFPLDAGIGQTPHIMAKLASERVIVPERSDFNDDLIAFGEETLAARIAPLIASIKPGGTVEERGVEVGE